MHRLHEAHHGAVCSRVTWLRTAPGAVTAGVDAVRLSLMPKLDDLPGFCSVSAMVRPDDGLAVAAVAYDSRADLEAAREGAREFREEFAPAMGIEMVDSAEFDLCSPTSGARDDLTRRVTCQRGVEPRVDAPDVALVHRGAGLVGQRPANAASM